MSLKALQTLQRRKQIIVRKKRRKTRKTTREEVSGKVITAVEQIRAAGDVRKRGGVGGASSGH